MSRPIMQSYRGGLSCLISMATTGVTSRSFSLVPGNLIQAAYSGYFPMSFIDATVRLKPVARSLHCFAISGLTAVKLEPVSIRPEMCEGVEGISNPTSFPSVISDEIALISMGMRGPSRKRIHGAHEYRNDSTKLIKSRKQSLRRPAEPRICSLPRTF